VGFFSFCTIPSGSSNRPPPLPSIYFPPLRLPPKVPEFPLPTLRLPQNSPDRDSPPPGKMARDRIPPIFASICASPMSCTFGHRWGFFPPGPIPASPMVWIFSIADFPSPRDDVNLDFLSVGPVLSGFTLKPPLCFHFFREASFPYHPPFV